MTSVILCYFVFDILPNMLFFSGATLVTISMYMYSFGPEKEKKEPATSRGEREGITLTTDIEKNEK